MSNATIIGYYSVSQPPLPAPKPMSVPLMDALLSDARLASSEDGALLLIHADEIRSSSKRIADAVLEVRQKARVRESYAKQIQKLRQLRDWIRAQDFAKDQKGDPFTNADTLLCRIGKWDGAVDQKDGQAESVANKLDQVKGYAAERQARWDKLADELGLHKMDFTIDPSTGRVVQDKSQNTLEEGGKVTSESLQTEVDRLTGKMQAIDSEREIGMLLLQSETNKKQQLVSETSALLKKQSDTKMAVIRNIG